MTICGPNNVQLTRNQVYQLAYGAGFRGASADVIVAVAMGESGWETGNCNLADANGGSYGILQINGSHFASGSTTKECAFDPACAFKYAYMLSNGGKDFTPWGAYTNGSYAQYLTAGFQPTGAQLNTPTTGNGQGIPGTPTDPLSQISNFFNGIQNFTNWLNDPVRIIKMVVGVGLVIVSVLVLFLPGAEQAVTQIATTVTKARNPVATIKRAASKGSKRAK